MKTVDLTPFGFTPTESLVYATLLRLGPTTGYAVALASRLARANAYGALEGLVTRGAATRVSPARPVRYRPTDPQALLAHLATLQGEALDRLARALRDTAHPHEPATKEVGGARAVANLILQLVARAERRVEGVLAAELWRPTLPAWRHASRTGGATVELRIAGDVPSGAEELTSGSVAADAPTILVVDEAQTVITAGAGDAIAGLWSSHPLIVMLARRSLGLVAFLILLVTAACRAAQIPVEKRYPAGSPFRAQFRVVDGTRLRMIDTGGGTPVVFIHGFGASVYSWRKTLAPVLAAGYRVIAIDNRGFGFSDKPAPTSRGSGGEKVYTNAAYARLVVALLDSLNLPSAVLVGHSMGGAIAAEVALAYPARVRGLVLIDAAGFGVRWPGVLTVGRWPGAGGVAAALRGRWITERMLRSTYGDPSKVTAEDVDQYYAPVAEPGYSRALRGVLREFRFDTLVGRLGAVAAPTLVIWGAADRWIPVGDGSRLATELPRGAFIVLPRIGHAAAEEDPDDVNGLLITFLKEGLPRVPENLAWSTPSSQLWRSSSRSIPPTRQRSAN